MTALVPELYVSNLSDSLAFYVGALGFNVVYERQDEHFAYLRSASGAELMLEEPVGRTWLAGELERPFGRGINLQIATVNAAGLFATLAAHALPIIQPLEECEYRRHTDTIRVRQFVICDPDGYLLRFQQVIKTRPTSAFIAHPRASP